MAISRLKWVLLYMLHICIYEIQQEEPLCFSVEWSSKIVNCEPENGLLNCAFVHISWFTQDKCNFCYAIATCKYVTLFFGGGAGWRVHSLVELHSIKVRHLIDRITSWMNPDVMNVSLRQESRKVSLQFRAVDVFWPTSRLPNVKMSKCKQCMVNKMLTKAVITLHTLPSLT
jgi:hypothetical protein